jgi:hypothetical protein
MRSQMRNKKHGEKVAQKIVERAIKKSEVFARKLFDRFAGPARVDKTAKDEALAVKYIIVDMPRPDPTLPIVDVPPDPEIMKKLFKPGTHQGEP